MTSSTRPILIHKPNCSKSREAVAYLRERGVEFDIVRYLETPLDAAAIRELSAKVGGAPSRLLRSKEPQYAELGLSPESTLGEVVAAIVAHPVLLERPILVVGDRAAIGRPLQNFDAFLG